jgi:hypothetical protein
MKPESRDARDLEVAGEVDLMAKRPVPQAIAAELSVMERVFLFCIASGTDWSRAGVTQATAQHMLVRGLVDRDNAALRFALTPQGQAVLDALLEPQR